MIGERFMLAICACLAACLCAFGAYLGVLKYRECRSHGFSVLYCIPTK